MSGAERPIERPLELFTLLVVAIAMAAAWAHLLELPHKIRLPAQDYLTVQQIYRGWALLGVAVIGAVLSTTLLAAIRRGGGACFRWTVTAAACTWLALLVFLLLTYPVNRATENWTLLPDDWERLRMRWEYSHAAGALLWFAALTCLVRATQARRSVHAAS